MEVLTAHRASLSRQVNHWLQAASRLSSLDHLASGYAWQGIDHKIGIQLKESLQKSIGEVVSLANTLKRQLDNAKEGDGLRAVKRGVIQLRDRYLKAVVI